MLEGWRDARRRAGKHAASLVKLFVKGGNLFIFRLRKWQKGKISQAKNHNPLCRAPGHDLTRCVYVTVSRSSKPVLRVNGLLDGINFACGRGALWLGLTTPGVPLKIEEEFARILSVGERSGPKRVGKNNSQENNPKDERSQGVFFGRSWLRKFHGTRQQS